MIIAANGTTKKLQAVSIYSKQQTPQTSTALSLRPYQSDAIAQVYDLIRQGDKKVLCCAPCGSGKTIVGCSMMRDCTIKHRKSAFLVDSKALINQTVSSLERMGIAATILQGRRKVDPDALCIIAMIQSVASKVKRGQTLQEIFGDVRLFIVDEAHQTAFSQIYSDIEKSFPDAAFVGMSATPWRLKPIEFLGQKFEKSIVVAQPPQMVREGHVLPCRGFMLKGVLDVAALKIGRDGDYEEGAIAAQATTEEAQANIFKEWQKFAHDRSTMVIGAKVEQVKAHADYFNARGVKSEVITGETPDDDREAIINRVKLGETRALMSVDALSYGFDCPIISCVLYIRQTASRALFNQVGGRGCRPYIGQADYLLLDFGTNLLRFGLPSATQDYSIDASDNPNRRVPVKPCPNCGFMMSRFALVCPNCGFEIEPKEREQNDLDEVQTRRFYEELVEFFDEETKEKVNALRAWKRQAFIDKANPDVPINRFFEEFGHTPPAVWMRHACLSKNYTPECVEVFIAYLQRHCAGGQFAERWKQHHIRVEFGYE